MKLCQVWDSDYPWDVRVEKICDSLIKEGHEVHLICRNKNTIREEYEVLNGLHIHRLPVIHKKFTSIFSFPFFFNPLWLLTIHSIVDKYKIDCIVVRDLPMALSGIIIAKIKKIPCFIDMAEPYPEMLQGYFILQKLSFTKKFINLIVRNYYLALIVERISCKLCDHIFPVSNEIKKGLMDKGVSESKITVFHNTPTLSFCKRYHEDKKNSKPADKGPIKIVYVGDLTENRGLPIIINAVEELKRQKEKYNLIIIGDGRYKNFLKKLVAKKKVADLVCFTGWVNHKDLITHLKACDIGIIPHLPTKHNNLTVPNKVFDYMALGLPILSGNLLPIKKIIEETRSGYIFDYQDSDSIVHQLLALKEQKLRDQLGMNGKIAVTQKYNWGVDFLNFTNIMNVYIS